jgi:hypothetical protein
MVYVNVQSEHKVQKDKTFAKLILIDLAGSERLKRSEVKLNPSLLLLLWPAL